MRVHVLTATAVAASLLSPVTVSRAEPAARAACPVVEVAPLSSDGPSTDTTARAVPGRDGKTYWVAPDVIVTGAMFARVWLDRDSARQPAIGVQLNAEGTRRFAAYTGKHVSEQMAVIVDRQVIETPFVQTPITQGHMVIIGQPAFSEEERGILANELAQCVLRRLS